NRLLGLRAPTNEIGHRIRPETQKRDTTTRQPSFGWQTHPELNAARLNGDYWSERRLDGRVVAFRYPHAFEVADQVPDDFYLVDIVVREFHGRELSFNLNHQVQTVEPVGPKIISEVRLIRDSFDVDA